MHGEGVEELAAAPPADVTVGPKTSLYLAEMAEKSFNRALDLDESVWRSLPFFAAGFGLALTMTAYLLGRLPAPDWSAYSIVTLVIVNLALISFLWSFQWFWRIIRRRSFRYPPDDRVFRDYAEIAGVYHADNGLDGDARDEATKLDLQNRVAIDFADATAVNAGHAVARLKARNQSLLFMMIGFALAFLAATIIFTAERFWPATKDKVLLDEPIRPSNPPFSPKGGAADPAPVTDRRAGREVLDVEDRAGNLRGSGEPVSDDARPIPVQRQ